jgi:hypothetical protein
MSSGVGSRKTRKLLVELGRRYAGRLMFRADSTFHPEKLLVTDVNTGAELKP